MKKILIFGLARSGTTLLQQQLSRSLRLMSYNEPFGDYKFREQIGDPYQWVSSLPRAVIKVLAQNLDYIDLTKLIDAGKFDSIVVTKRSNLTDLCVSLYYAEQVTKNYHYTVAPDSINPFTVPPELVKEFFLISYRWYLGAMKQLNERSIPYTIFDYDQYQARDTLTINGVEFCLDNESKYGIDTISANIDYSQVCVNYNEIDLLIKHENNC